jgi:hypothetical protein
MYKIAIPSKGRIGKLKTKELLKSGIIYCPENEYKDYKKIYNEVIAVPNDIYGITKTRNWILKNNDCDIIFIDDDLKNTGYWEKKYINSDGKKFTKINDENTLLNEFERLFGITYELGYKIFGLRTEQSQWSQHDEAPILFQSYVTASCMGIINDGSIYFDEKYIVKEDYEICLRHIAEYGGILSVKYLTWENEHIYKTGGCQSYRNNENEKSAIDMLIKAYPNNVKIKKSQTNNYSIRLQF